GARRTAGASGSALLAPDGQGTALRAAGAPRAPHQEGAVSDVSGSSPRRRVGRREFVRVGVGGTVGLALACAPAAPASPPASRPAPSAPGPAAAAPAVGAPATARPLDVVRRGSLRGISF